MLLFEGRSKVLNINNILYNIYIIYYYKYIYNMKNITLYKKHKVRKRGVKSTSHVIIELEIVLLEELEKHK